MSETLEKCGNCGRVIGKLEAPHIFGVNVVCTECKARLESAAAQQPPAAPPMQSNVPSYAPPPRQDDLVRALIPRNGFALASYYVGIFSLLPCVGALSGPVAVGLGIKGLMVAKQRPAAKGAVHAWVGIICGGIFGLGYTVAIILFVLFSARS